MVKLNLDGAGHSGHYRCDCECGLNWNGTTERASDDLYSPALPIAECVVHVRMCHDDDVPQLVFAIRFELWLKNYWELMSLRQMGGMVAAR